MISRECPACGRHHEATAPCGIKPLEYRVDALTREQQELVAAVVVFQRTGHCPTTGDLAELLGWLRLRVERVARELVAEGMLKRTVGGGAWSDN